MVQSHPLSMSGFRSSPSQLNIGDLQSLRGGNLAGPGSALVPVHPSGARGCESDCSGGCLLILGLEGLSGVSGMNVPGSDCSLKGALVGV